MRIGNAVFLIVTVIVVLLSGCDKDKGGNSAKSGTSKINEKTAIDLINTCISDGYRSFGWTREEEEKEFNLYKEEIRRGILELLANSKQLGLIDYTIQSQPPINADGEFPLDYYAKFTEMGEQLLYRREEGNPFFKTSRRKVSKIVSIPDNNTVLFSYVHSPTKIGIAVGLKEPLLLRGKIRYRYDPFLDKYIVEGFWWSQWEEERWIRGQTYDVVAERRLVEICRQ